MLEFMDALLWGTGALVWLDAGFIGLGILSGRIKIYTEEVNDANT